MSGEAEASKEAESKAVDEKAAPNEAEAEAQAEAEAEAEAEAKAAAADVQAMEAEAERTAKAVQYAEHVRLYEEWRAKAIRLTYLFHFGHSTPSTHRTDLFYTPSASATGGSKPSASASASASAPALACKPMALRVLTTAPTLAGGKCDSTLCLVDLEAGKTSKPFAPHPSPVVQAWVYTKPAHNPFWLSADEETAQTKRFLAGRPRSQALDKPDASESGGLCWFSD